MFNGHFTFSSSQLCLTSKYSLLLTINICWERSVYSVDALPLKEIHQGDDIWVHILLPFFLSFSFCLSHFHLWVKVLVQSNENIFTV